MYSAIYQKVKIRKVRIMKKSTLFAVITSISLVFNGCSSAKDNIEKADKENVNIKPAVTTLSPSDSIKKENIEYTVLSEFKPFKVDSGYGANILIQEDATKEQIVELIKILAKDKDLVAIDIFTKKVAYDEYIIHKTTENFRKGYIASYTKNKKLQDKPFYNENNITWMQESGKFSELFGTTINLDN